MPILKYYFYINYYDISKQYLKENFEQYIGSKSNRLGGFLEFMFENIDEKSYEDIFKFINDYKIRFCRPDFCNLNLYKQAAKNSTYLNMILASENSQNIINFLNDY